MAVSSSMKYSRQREMIFNQVKNFPVHPTADDIYTALKKENPGLSLGTVYRNLNLLSELGQLNKIHIDNAQKSKDRFDARTDPHCHLLCTKCGRVFDVEDSAIDGAKERIFEKYGHVIEEISLNFKGICRDCAKEKNIKGDCDEPTMQMKDYLQSNT